MRQRRRGRSLGRSTATLAAAAALALTAAVPADAGPGGTAADALAPLVVDGNRVTTGGETFTFQGVSVMAPEQNDVCPECSPRPTSEMIDLAAQWGANVVRLPVTEVYGSTDLAAYDASYIEPYVQQAVDLGIYLIIDLHYVRDYGDGEGAIPASVVQRFWDYIAPRYGDISNVVFEVFNEPLNPASWATWKSYIQPVVDSLRESAPDTLILMGSPSWSTMPGGAVGDPVADHNTAYVYHLYPNQGAPTTSLLDSKFGTAAQSIPVVVSEFGWNPPGPYSDSVTAGTTSTWGVPFRDYLDARPHIGWQAWILDNFWKPQMFDEDWNLLGGEHQGAFIRDWLGGLPNTSPCESHLAVGAEVDVSSELSGDYPGANLVDGDCTDAGRWISAEGDATPTATVTLAEPATVTSVGVYSGYGGYLPLVDFTLEVRVDGVWQQVADVVGNTQTTLEVPVGVAGVEALRIVVSDPSDSATEAELARVHELAVR